MSFRTVLLATALVSAGLPAFAERSADDIHRSVLVFDPHVDIRSPYDWQSEGQIVVPEIRQDQVTTEKLRKGGYDAIGLAVFVPQTARTPETYRLARLEAEAKLDFIDALAASQPETYVIATTADEVKRAEKDGKIAIVPTILNAFPLGETSDNVDEFYARGVRILGFTHAGHNAFADSNRPQQRDVSIEHGGLSDQGKALVKRANELGILLDVSQLSDDAFRQVLALSTAPVIASHSGVYAKSPSPRGLTDEELDLIRDNGGVAGIVAFSSYLLPTPEDVSRQIADIRKRYGATNGYEGLSVEEREALGAETRALQQRATVADYVDSLDYAVQRIGIDHVAISSDFNHGGRVQGWAEAAEAGAVTEELLSRGYSEEDIAKLWGGNVLRVLAAAQVAAAPAQSPAP